MKNKILKGLATAAVCSMGLFAEKAAAQITAVDITTFADSVSSSCVVPVTNWYFGYGTYTGTPTVGNDSITVYINWGDGDDTTFKDYVYPPSGGTGGYGIGELQHTYTLPGTYYPLLIVTADDGPSDTYTAPAAIVITDDCAPLTGKLYLDADNDCVKDAGELPLIWHSVLITNTTTGTIQYAYTDANGDYSANIPAGYTYSVAPGVTGGLYGLSVVCPVSGVTMITTVTGSTYTADFGYDCAESAIDMSAAAYAWNWRPGYERPLYVYGNLGSYCSADAATVTVTLPAGLTYSSAIYNAPTSVSGSTLTWNVPGAISLYDYFGSGLNIYCDPSATMGDSLCVDVTITPVSATDVDMSNNSYTLCAVISNSMDPNQKGVAPKGLQEEGFIAAANEPMTYLVEFQNTGNDVAYNVTIADKIDEHLSLGTLKVLSASHPMTLAIGDDREVKFRFADINLPDSLSDEPNSHGYVLYTIRQANALTPGTEITNTAHIFFDYNEAIITNTTLNTIEIPTNIAHVAAGNLKAEVFPNPAASELNIRMKDNAGFTATLMDMTGRTVQSVNGQGTASFNTSSVAAGLYLLHIADGTGAVLSTKVEVKH